MWLFCLEYNVRGWDKNAAKISEHTDGDGAF